jgi:hypothetical protein
VIRRPRRCSDSSIGFRRTVHAWTVRELFPLTTRQQDGSRKPKPTTRASRLARGKQRSHFFIGSYLPSSVFILIV